MDLLAGIIDFDPGRMMKKTTRTILLVCGIFFLILSIIGMFLPILPTTPFLLLASYCFTRSSKKINDWLLSNRWFGSYIKNYREGNGITLAHKVIALSFLWLTIGYSAWIVSFWWLKLLLIGIALGVTFHLLKIKTYQPGSLITNHETQPTSSDEVE